MTRTRTFGSLEVGWFIRFQFSGGGIEFVLLNFVQLAGMWREDEFIGRVSLDAVGFLSRFDNLNRLAGYRSINDFTDADIAFPVTGRQQPFPGFVRINVSGTARRWSDGEAF